MMGGDWMTGERRWEYQKRGGPGAGCGNSAYGAPGPGARGLELQNGVSQNRLQQAKKFLHR